MLITNLPKLSWYELLGLSRRNTNIFFTRTDLSVFREIYFDLAGQKCVLFAGSLRVSIFTLQEHQTIPTNATESTDSDIENAL